MINIDEFKQAFEYRVNHSQQGSFTLEQFNSACYIASLGLFNKFLGLEEQYHPQIKSATIHYPITQKVHTDLLPFRMHRDIAPTDFEFIKSSDLPVDMVFITNVRGIYIVDAKDNAVKKRLTRCGCTQFGDTRNSTFKKYINDIRFTTEDKWSNRVSSRLLRSDSYMPVGDGIALNFRIQPTQIRIEYLKTPNKVRWAYTIQNDVPVYDAVNSINFEWSELMVDRLLQRMDNIYSRNVSDNLGLQVSQNKIRTGE
jgi:hypothetical protein